MTSTSTLNVSDITYDSSSSVTVGICQKCRGVMMPGSVHVCESFLRVTYPKTKSVLHVSPYLMIEHTTPKPNRWHRFWYRVLLGWTWTDVK